MQVSQPSCPICRSTRNKRFPPAYIDGKLFQCLDCDLGFAHPQPTDEELAKIYDETYYQNPELGDRGYEDYEGDKDNLLRTFRRRMEKFIMRNNSEPGRLLDVGCAHGFFMEAAADHGWDVYGIDISATAIEYARKRFGDQVMEGQFPDSTLPSNHFQVITMWDYLEHTFDPRAELEKAHELLTENGMLALVVPELGSWPERIMRHRWLHYKPEHLLYFTRKNIRRLLEETGFRVNSIRYEGKHVTIAFFLKRLSLYLPFVKRPINRLLAVPRINRQSFYVNPLDFMLVLAQKTDRAEAQ